MTEVLSIKGNPLRRYQFFQKFLISDYFFALPDDEFVKKFEILQRWFSLAIALVFTFIIFLKYYSFKQNAPTNPNILRTPKSLKQVKTV